MTKERRPAAEGVGPTATASQETSPDRPPYEPPAVITYHREELLEELGPAHACSFSASIVMSC